MKTTITEPSAIFPIGYKFHKRVSKNKSDMYEVVDYFKTYNGRGELVKFRYHCVHMFCGQPVHDYDICHTTIALATKA